MLLSSSSGPSLEFEWELSIFRGLRALGKRLFTRQKEPASPHIVELSTKQESLTVLAQIVAEYPLRIHASRGTAGFAGATIFLPMYIDGFGTAQDHETIYLIRTLLAAEMIRQGAHLSPPSQPLLRARYEADAVISATTQLAAEFPRFRTISTPIAAQILTMRSSVVFTIEGMPLEAERRRALAYLADTPAPPITTHHGTKVSLPVILWGEILRDADLSREERTITKDQVRPPVAVTTEIAAPEAGEVRYVHLDKKKIEEATLMHTFEKIETADAFLGGGRDLDGTDQLDDHSEALEEVPLAAVTRSDEDVHAVLRADVGSFSGAPDVAATEPQSHGIPYDEWDGKHRSYRKNFCTVYPSCAPKGDLRKSNARILHHRKLIEETQRIVEQALLRLAPRRRQQDGEQVDLDALIRHLADLQSGHATGDRLYIRRARHLPSLATLLLLDTSLSSDSWVDDQRVLDIEQDAALVLGEVLDRLGESLEILAFSSHTRNRCQVLDVRRRKDPWSVGKSRIAGLHPQGYTRIGPALRHATAELQRADAERRVLLLLSDGKPTDYDRYEGRHGIEDVRQAVREANQHGVHVHGLTLDVRTRDAFPAMFGAGRYHTLSDLRALPHALAAIYARIRTS